MKRLLNFAFAAIGAGAFGFLLWKSDQATQGRSPGVPQQAVENPVGATGGGLQQATPAISAVAQVFDGESVSSGIPAEHDRTMVDRNIPTAAASVDSMSASGSANAPGSALQNPPLPAAAGPAVVDLPMGWGAPVREISIPVPEGEMVPAVFQDDTPKPTPQMKALDRIAAEFEENVREIPPGMTQTEAWGLAREIADERYITLFGYQAYNQYHLRGAREALKEKRARANP